MTIFNVETPPRHALLNGKLSSTVIDKFEEEINQGTKNYGSSNICLTYFDETIEGASLVDLSQLDDIDYFIENEISDLHYVMPDIFLFDKQPFVTNKTGVKIAGFPDLIIEIWSPGNSKTHREFLHNLYQTSPVTEIWHLTLNSNIVHRWLGKKRLEDTTLLEIMESRTGLKFDLTRSALPQ
ncbi:MAG: hypothetical protein FWG64_13605 [Firmicutes bacterium]|nr:hypothetical protein [Bacillota bacterium]